MLDVVGFLASFITGLLSLKIPGTGFSFVSFSVFVYVLHLIGKLLHSVYNDDGSGGPGGLIG